MVAAIAGRAASQSRPDVEHNPHDRVEGKRSADILGDLPNAVVKSAKWHTQEANVIRSALNLFLYTRFYNADLIRQIGAEVLKT
jgi:hypothetical protein